MTEEEQARLEEIMENERRRRERGAPSRFAYEENSGYGNPLAELGLFTGLLGGAPAGQEKPNWEEIAARLGSAMAFGGTGAAVLSGLNGFRRGAEAALQRERGETPEDWRPMLTHEIKTIPNPDYDPDEVIHEILSRYYRGGER